MLKEFIHKMSYPIGYQATIDALVSRLKELDIHVDTVDEGKGKIEARCLALLANWIVWKCWSERVLLEIEKVNEHTTDVRLYAIPNLVRIRTKKEERVIDLSMLASKLTM